MTETLRQFIEAASFGAEKIFRKQGVITPMWHCVKADGSEFVMNAPDGSKDVSAAIARAYFELNGVVRCMFIDEAWIVEADGDLASDELLAIYRSQGSIADHPKRQEVVAFIAEDQSGGTLQARRPIIRPRHGKPRLGPLHFDDDITQSEGRLVGMLRAPPGTKVQ
jgi:hypothetical protein